MKAGQHRAPVAAALDTAGLGRDHEKAEACLQACLPPPAATLASDEFTENQQFHVLLVDDDPVTLRAVEQLLKKFNYSVTAVTTGREAIKHLEASKASQARPIDLVLTDILMPEVSGFDLMHEVMHGTMFSEVPVVVMSSQDSQESVLQAFEAGAADYLIKPIRRNEVATLWQHVWRANRFKASLSAAGTAGMASSLYPPNVHSSLQNGQKKTAADPKQSNGETTGPTTGTKNGSSGASTSMADQGSTMFTSAAQAAFQRHCTGASGTLNRTDGGSGTHADSTAPSQTGISIYRQNQPTQSRQKPTAGLPNSGSQDMPSSRWDAGVGASATATETHHRLKHASNTGGSGRDVSQTATNSEDQAGTSTLDEDEDDDGEGRATSPMTQFTTDVQGRLQVAAPHSAPANAAVPHSKPASSPAAQPAQPAAPPPAAAVKVDADAVVGAAGATVSAPTRPLPGRSTSMLTGSSSEHTSHGTMQLPLALQELAALGQQRQEERERMAASVERLSDGMHGLVKLEPSSAAAQQQDMQVDGGNTNTLDDQEAVNAASLLLGVAAAAAAEHESRLQVVAAVEGAQHHQHHQHHHHKSNDRMSSMSHGSNTVSHSSRSAFSALTVILPRRSPAVAPAPGLTPQDDNSQQQPSGSNQQGPPQHHYHHHHHHHHHQQPAAASGVPVQGHNAQQQVPATTLQPPNFGLPGGVGQTGQQDGSLVPHPGLFLPHAPQLMLPHAVMPLLALGFGGLHTDPASLFAPHLLNPHALTPPPQPHGEQAAQHSAGVTMGGFVSGGGAGSSAGGAPPHPAFPSVVLIAGRAEHANTAAARRHVAIQKYLLKKKNRSFKKKVRYESRKRLAEARPRVRGQFVKQDPGAASAAAANAAASTTPPAGSSGGGGKAFRAVTPTNASSGKHSGSGGGSTGLRGKRQRTDLGSRVSMEQDDDDEEDDVEDEVMESEEGDDGEADE